MRNRRNDGITKKTFRGINTEKMKMSSFIKEAGEKRKEPMWKWRIGGL